MIKNKYKYIVGACCGIGILALYNINTVRNNNYIVKATILDVGTGDAVHIKTSNADYLIDNGGNMQYSNLNNYTQNNEIIYDAIIVTNDRTKNLEKIITDNKAEKLLVPVNYEMKDYDNIIELGNYAENTEIALDANVSLNCAGTDGKNASFVLEIEEMPVCLFAQNSAEDLNEIYDIPIIKLSKGGDEKSLSEEMLNNINPDEIIISVKENNSKELPDENILELIENKDITLYQTSDDGAVTITWTESGDYTIYAMK